MGDVIYEMGAWLYKLLITLIIAVVSIVLVLGAVSKELNTRELQGDLLLTRLLYSPDSVWYAVNGVVHPGIVDLEKFDTTRLMSNFAYRTDYGGAKLTLSYGNEQKVAYVEEATFEKYKDQYLKGWENGGVVDTHIYPVVVKAPRGEVNGILTVEIAMPEKA